MADSSSVLGWRSPRIDDPRSRPLFESSSAPLPVPTFRFRILRVDRFSFRTGCFTFFIAKITDKFRRQIAKRCRPQISQIFADYQTNQKPADGARDLALQNSATIPDET